MDSSFLPRGRSAPALSTTVPIPTAGWDFFISHAGADSEHAEQLRLELEDRGASVFEDSMLPAGSVWDRELPAQLKSSAVCVVLVSIRTEQAHYQRSEYQMAIDLFRHDPRRRIVPVYLEPLAGRERPFGLGVLTSIELDDNVRLADAAARLVAELSEARSLPSPGPQEAALEAATLLLRLDQACLRLGEPADEPELAAIVEQAMARVDGACPRDADAALRAALPVRGLDPRILLTASPDHEHAVDAWLTVDQSDPAVQAAEPLDTLLSDLRRSVQDLLLADEPLSERLCTTATRSHLRRLMAGPTAVTSVTTETFRAALEARLPPIRSSSREAVVVTESARVAGVAEEPLRFSLTYVAGQMCRLPPRDPLLAGIDDVVGRQRELLLAALAQSDSAVAWYSGSPGVGASTLGIEVARTLNQDDQRDVRYVDLRGLDPRARRNTGEIARLLATSLDIGFPRTLTDDEQVAFLRSELEGTRLLLVLDNALDAAHVAPFLPIASSCALIATSRNRLQAHAPPSLTVHASPLRRRDSITVLSRAVDRALDPTSELDAIARLCADVPLALRLAGAWMASRPELAPSDFARLLEETLTRLDYLADGERAVRAAVDLSYQHLDSETRRLLCFTALAPGRTVTASELSQALGEHAARVELLLQRLVDLNLAVQTPLRTVSGQPVLRYSLPELVHLFAAERARAEQSAEATVAFQRRYVAALARRLEEVIEDELHADVSLELDTHALREALRMAAENRWVTEGLALAVNAEALAGAQPDVALIQDVAQRLIALHLAADAPEQAALAALRLAETMRRRGRPALAEEAFEQARALAARHTLPELEATAVFHLSGLAADEERWEEALRLGSSAAATFERLHKHRRTASVAMNNSNLAAQADDMTAAAQWARTAWEQSRRGPLDHIRAHAAFRYAGVAMLLDEPPSVTFDAYREATRLFADDESWGNAAVAAYCAAEVAAAIDDDATMLDFAELELAHVRRDDQPSFVAAALVNVASAHFRARAHERAARALTEAEELLCPFGPPPLSLRLDPAPPKLRYEVLVRRLALRSVTGERGLLTIVGPARRRLPTRPGDPRVDPELEWVLESIGMVEADEELHATLRPRLESLLRAPVEHRPPYGSFWLYDDLPTEPEPVAALDP